MNHEQRFNLDLERLAWSCARERFRASRDQLFILVLTDKPMVVSRKGRYLFAHSPTSAMHHVVFYDGVEAASDAALELAKLKSGEVAFEPVPAYEYAKAREYSCRLALAKAH